MALPDIMTAQEVATLLRVTAHHVRDLAKIGELPHMRIGTEFRFVPDELIDKYPGLARLANQPTEKGCVK